MESKLLTELLSLPGCIVKNKMIKDDKIFLTIERKRFPICPKYKQLYVTAPKDSQFREFEDLSVFGRRCFLRLYKFRITRVPFYNNTNENEFFYSMKEVFGI